MSSLVSSSAPSPPPTSTPSAAAAAGRLCFGRTATVAAAARWRGTASVRTTSAVALLFMSLIISMRIGLRTKDESDGGNQPTRSFCLSMFEIISEGKAERILDLLSDAAYLVLQQSTIIKGLKEVAISNFVDGQSLVSRGMLKRTTAATNANSESRHVFYMD